VNNHLRNTDDHQPPPPFSLIANAAEQGVLLGRLGNRLGVEAPLVAVMLLGGVGVQGPLERLVDVLASLVAGAAAGDGIVEDQGVDDIQGED